MKDNISLKKKISNAKWLRNLEQTKLKYSKAILSLLEDNPTLLDELLQDLDVTDDDFFRKITGEENDNISFYDQGLESIKYLTKNKSNIIQKR